MLGRNEFSTANPNFYTLLGVAENCPQKDLRKAYLEQALIKHLDKNGNTVQATQDFQILSDAYTVLSNSSTRAEYDEWLHDVEAPVENPDGSSAREEGGCKCHYCSMDDAFDDEDPVPRTDRHLREARWKGRPIPKTYEEVQKEYEELLQEYENVNRECERASLQYEIGIRARTEPDDPRAYIKARVVYMRAEEIKEDLERLKNPTKNVEWMGEQKWLPSTKFCRATSPKEIEGDPDEMIVDPWGDQFWNEWFWEDFA